MPRWEASLRARFNYSFAFLKTQRGAAAVAAAAAAAPPPAPPQPPPSPGAQAVPPAFRLRAKAELEFHAMAALQVYAVGSPELLIRPCVDCGLKTGGYCDKCLAEDRMPEEEWAEGQRTPLCSRCDNKYSGLCHYCRAQAWCVPATQDSD